jgi:Zn finger protein HypA/HybF involved in hydrogenase expression
METEDENDETFDAEELTEGFDEVAAEDIDSEDVLEADGEDVLVVDDDEGEVIEEVAVVPLPVEEDDVVDDADIELALDEVLAETIMRTSTAEEDEDDSPIETVVDPDGAEAILPKQDDEFRCKSCRLLKKTTQLADKRNSLCRDCV